MSDPSPPGGPAENSSLQCDLRDILTPALLAADLLRRHADPVVVKRAETVVVGIMRVVERLEWIDGVPGVRLNSGPIIADQLASKRAEP